MAAFNFPDTTGAPTDGTFTYQPIADGIEYAWNGTTWQIVGTGAGGGGGASIGVGSTPPADAEEGDLWWNTDDGRLYVYYVQGNGQSQWVEAAPNAGFDGGVVNNSITQPVRTITTEFDLSTGPFWTADAIDIPNPTNAVSGMTGTIRLTDAPTSWESSFKFSNGTWSEPSAYPAIVPFYVHDATTIEVGIPTPGFA